jgi:hypothetical protein
MSIIIQPYRDEHQNAVTAFNQRLRAATSNPDLVFYERSAAAWLPRVQDSPLHNQYFLALEDGTVRGAYALKYERFFLARQGEYDVACYHHPLSEGIVNRTYAAVGSLLLRDAVWREPMLYALGMGGADRPLAKMLKVMGWSLQPVPFFFRVVRPYKFLRRMNVLRQSSLKRWVMDLGAFSGTGWAAISAAQAAKRMRAGQPSAFEVVKVDELPASADVLWNEAKDDYRVASVRDHQTLSRLYPPSEKHLTKLCVTRHGTLIGWAVVGERRKDTRFGSLRVGSIVDCWARLENAPQVMRAATQVLEGQEMDLIVSNQSHKLWGRALEGCGFLRAESNFVFATSKQHSALLRGDLSEFHLTRANGDGLPRNF